MKSKVNVKEYWDRRYKSGGNSGAGSYGALREFKINFLNSFIAENGVSSLVDLGCGDGSVASGIVVESYTGLDISEQALTLCKKAVRTQGARFFCTETFPYREHAGAFDVALSMDVIFHLVEDSLFVKYMANLFSLSGKYVIIYSSDREDDGSSPCHLKHRRISEYIKESEPGWSLLRTVCNKYPFAGDHVNQSFSDFFIYMRTQPPVPDSGGSSREAE